MHIDFALPVNGSLSAGLTEWRRKAAIAVMDYGFHMAVTSWDAQVSLSMLNLKACSYTSVPLCLVACAVMLTSATPGMAQGCGPRTQSIVPQGKVLEKICICRWRGTWRRWHMWASTASSSSWHTRASSRCDIRCHISDPHNNGLHAGRRLAV